MLTFVHFNNSFIQELERSLKDDDCPHFTEKMVLFQACFGSATGQGCKDCTTTISQKIHGVIDERLGHVILMAMDKMLSLALEPRAATEYITECELN